MEDVELGVAPPAAAAAAAAATSAEQEQEHAQARRKTPADLYYDTRNRQSSKNVLLSSSHPSSSNMNGNGNGNGNSNGNGNAKDGKKKGSDKDVDGKDDKKGKKEKVPKPPSVKFHQMFRFSTKLERFYIFIGAISSIGHGVLMPMFALLFGDLINAFNPTDANALMDTVGTLCIKFVILGAIAGVTSYLQVMLFLLTGTRQANRIREIYFRSVLRQEMAYYDVHNSGEVATRMAGDVLLIQDGISDKVGSMLQFLAMFVAGFVVGFVNGWKMSLVILAIVPLLILCGAAMGTILANFSSKGQTAYAKAGSVAEEVLSSMRTVASFSGESREVDRYGRDLELARSQNTRKGLLAGLALGLTMFIMFASYGLAFWYGSTLVISGEMTAGNVVTTFFGIIMGAMALGQAAPSFSTIATGTGAAYIIFQTIDREPLIDNLSDKGKKLDKVRGHIQFKDIRFRYPTRPDVPILNGINLELQPGKTLALVGPSGCGKSTTVSLLQRFYDPLEGQVLVDGVDIRELNIRWLRSQIGVVSQEPVLFNKTIAENIAMGKPGASMHEIHEAARQANAHDFIMRLPLQYDTRVGQRGTQLSGGQKQRVAIARALIKNPPILLLDEATSALDTKSERVVQEALDRARQGRCSIVIAHRLSTIRDADKIVVFDKGNVIEQGTHHELMAIENGMYANLVRLQQLRGAIKGTSRLKSRDGEQTAAAAATAAAATTAGPAAAVGADAANEEEEEDDDDDVDVDDIALAEKEAQRKAKAAAATPKPSKGTRTESSTGSATGTAAGGASADKDSDKDKELPVTVDDINTKGVIKRTYWMNRFETPAILLGTLSSAVSGAIFPVFAIIFSQVLSDLVTLTGSALQESIRFWCLMFLVIAAVVFLSNFGQQSMFAYSGEKLTYRLRLLLFKSFLRQEIGWFDDARRSTGVLSTKLANDVARIEGITGARLGMLAQLVATVVSGLVIAFTADWRLALVILATLPLMAIGGMMQMRVMMGFNQKARKSYEQSGAIASEAVDNVRTVLSVNQEDAFMKDYSLALDVPLKAAVRNAHISGAAFGFGELNVFLVWALAFYYGAKLVSWGLSTFQDMMRATSAIIFSSMTLGQIASMSGDFSKASIAAAELFAIADRVPPIDSYSDAGKQPESCEGNISLKGVQFAYPARPDVIVLKGIDVDVPAGKTVALVGSSGCGKSTIIQLVERFYDPAQGTVLIDGQDLRELNIGWARSQIGLVSQEPILYVGTVRQNIQYGKPTATQEEIEVAAKEANVHNFIMSLPDGYETEVGEKGTQLSGGQKQRIAIARALVRNPKILLLDEATSALDSESEKIVQEALDKARKGRTTLVIAHRLSTIQDADTILVLDAGVVVEQGTHNDLIARDGRYAALVKNQSLSMI